MTHAWSGQMFQKNASNQSGGTWDHAALQSQTFEMKYPDPGPRPPACPSCGTCPTCGARRTPLPWTTTPAYPYWQAPTYPLVTYTSRGNLSQQSDYALTARNVRAG